MNWVRENALEAIKLSTFTALLGWLINKFLKGGKMEKDIALGPEGQLVMKLEAGKVVISLSDVHASGSVSLSVSEDAGYFLDKLAALIPGQVDDAVIAVIKAALKAA
jgi:hypothetical protein